MKGSISKVNVEMIVEAHPHVFQESLAQRSVRWTTGGALGLFTVYCLFTLGFFDLGRLAEGAGKLFGVVELMLPPASHGRTGTFFGALLETLGMAFLGTLLAAAFSVPLGFMGATNVIGNAVFHFGLRRIFDFVRGVDALIWALVWINVVGLGPFAGILAIVLTEGEQVRSPGGVSFGHPLEFNQSAREQRVQATSQIVDHVDLL